MFNKRLVITINLVLLMLSTNFGFANKGISSKIYSGIEIGSKGIKFAVVELLDNQKTFKSFTMVYDSTINTNILNFTKQATNETLDAVLFFYNKASNYFQIKNNDIYITISSSLIDEATKQNKIKLIEELQENLKAKTLNDDLNWEVISTESEAEMLFNSLVPIAAKQETLLLNFGNSAIKGGFYGENKEDFESFGLNYGGGSLLKKMIKTLPSGFNKEQFYNQLHIELNTLLKTELNELFNTRVGYTEKRNIICAGGIAWAINNLLMPNQSKFDFLQVNAAQLEELKTILKDNFDKTTLTSDLFTSKIKNETAKNLASAKLHQVLKIFDTKTLICGVELVSILIDNCQKNQKSPYILITQHGSSGWIPEYIQQKTSGGLPTSY